MLKHSGLPSKYFQAYVKLRHFRTVVWRGCNLQLKSNLTSSGDTESLWITITWHIQTASHRKSIEAGGVVIVCMWAHCLNSVRVAALAEPSWTISCARDPLYWTTLNLDSLPANWKEKHCMVTVCFGLCVLCLQACVFLCQHFCVPPILTNYIQTGRGESLERHKSKFQNQRQYLSFTLSILRSVLKVPNISEKLFLQYCWYDFK